MTSEVAERSEVTPDRARDRREWDVETAEIAPGGYGDCWMKWMKAPRVGNPGAGEGYAPFSYTQLIVQAPGTHPGGRFWWITSSPDVLTVAEIKERTAVR
jgi:hypothetical protein